MTCPREVHRERVNAVTSVRYLYFVSRFGRAADLISIAGRMK